MEDTDTLTEGSSINKHTEDIQEIITKVPIWILRWGITIIFGILLIIVVISSFVRYPDTIKTGLEIRSADVCASVSPGVDCKITRLFIKQGALVKRGQPLVELESLNAPDNRHILNAPQTGRANFAGIVQPGIYLKHHQAVFTIRPEKEHFFGIIQVPSFAIQKVKINQKVLISLKNYPANEYGPLTGRVTYIADEPAETSLFLIKVTFDYSALKHSIRLKEWMTGNAEIITQDVSVLKRITSNLFQFPK